MSIHRHRPWRSAAAWTLACLAAVSHAQDLEPPPVEWPDVPAHATTADGFAPPGWRVERAVEGHLDEDGRSDLLLVLKMDDPANVLAHDGPGPSRFDTNPRMLVVALADADGYRRLVADHALIPRPHSPAHDDVLPEDALGIAPSRVFSVTLHAWASAGSWASTQRSFAFRIQDGCARLVGLDETSLHRATGEITQRSLNFLTGRGWTRTGSIEDDAEGERRWMRLPRDGFTCLQEVGDGFSFEPALAP